MKHAAQIQKEFVKSAVEWDSLSFEVQRDYLRKHPGSRKRLTAKPETPSSFSAGDVKNAVHELRNMTPDRLTEIFDDSGLLDMEFEEVTLKDIKFGDGKIDAVYDVIWFNEDDDRQERTTNFVSWDGKNFTADVSGVSQPLDDEDDEDDDVDIGGYVENITSHPDWNLDVAALKSVWEKWKQGPETEASMIPAAEKDLKEYLQAQIDSIFS